MGSAVIHVVDDDPGIRDSLAAVLEAAGHEAICHASGEAFLSAAAGKRCDVALLDLQLPGKDGLSTLNDWVGGGGNGKVIMISGHGDIPLAVRALQQGAVDFVEKPFAPDRVLAAINRALELGGAAPAGVVNEFAALVATLSPREREVLQHLAAGEANKVVARALKISPRTVEVHRARVMQKLKVKSFAEMVRVAVASGLTRNVASHGT
jgi:two-component system response regulator FixJ